MQVEEQENMAIGERVDDGGGGILGEIGRAQTECYSRPTGEGGWMENLDILFDIDDAEVDEGTMSSEASLEGEGLLDGIWEGICHGM
jgi:hypothetical protein